MFVRPLQLATGSCMHHARQQAAVAAGIWVAECVIQEAPPCGEFGRGGPETTERDAAPSEGEVDTGLMWP